MDGPYLHLSILIYSYQNKRTRPSQRYSYYCHEKLLDASAPNILIDYFIRWVTFANATPKAWIAENGYWKSSVYAFPSIRPNCMTWKGMESLH